jgi:hypothetical protein
MHRADQRRADDSIRGKQLRAASGADSPGHAELALDHQQRGSLAGHLDRVRMRELVGREPAANPGRQRGVVQLAADAGR